jgi:hypothetical protein
MRPVSWMSATCQLCFIMAFLTLCSDLVLQWMLIVTIYRIAPAIVIGAIISEGWRFMLVGWLAAVGRNRVCWCGCALMMY